MVERSIDVEEFVAVENRSAKAFPCGVGDESFRIASHGLILEQRLASFDFGARWRSLVCQLPQSLQTRRELYACFASDTIG